MAKELEFSVRQRTRTRALDLRPSRPTNSGKSRSSKKEESIHELALKDYVGRQQVEDPFKNNYGLPPDSSNFLFAPPFNFTSLMRLPKESSMLHQCIAAMVTNTVGHGFFLEYIGPDGERESEPAKKEREDIMGLLEYPNDEHSLFNILSKEKMDKETLGQGYLEVGRDEDGVVVMIAHLPSHLMRISPKDADPIDVKVKLPRRGGSETITIKKRFRRFVQTVGSRKVYFKEFGDPRSIDPATGFENPGLPIDQQATEVIYDPCYSPGEIYGLPRWINQMPSILGSREAELTNLSFFKDNAIPAMVMLVGGGILTQDAIDNMEAEFESARGRDSHNKIMIIEVAGDARLASPTGQVPAPSVEMKELNTARQNDAIFAEFDKQARTKIRGSFRLPPIFVGDAQDYTYASAKTSFEVAESQVFGPERSLTEDIFNRKILASMDVKFWRFSLRAPQITDSDEVVKAIETFDRVGAMTVNRAIEMANEYFHTEVPLVQDKWGNWPFTIVRQLAVTGQLKGVEEIFVQLEKVTAPEDQNGGEGEEETPNDPPEEPGAPPITERETKNRETRSRIRKHISELRESLQKPELEMSDT